MLRRVLGYAPLLVLPTSLAMVPFVRGWSVAAAIGVATLSGWLLFRDTMDLVQGVGRLYWLTRQTSARRLGVRFSYMRETDYPWRTGRGLQLVVPYRTFQIGICRPSKHYTVEDGLLHSLAARRLPTEPEDIREWQ